MSFILNKKPNVKPSDIKVLPSGDLAASDVLSALYELDSDLTEAKEMITGVQGVTVVSNSEPTDANGLWIDLNEN